MQFDYANSLKLEYAYICIAVPTLGMIKVSVLLFYRRIFVINKWSHGDARNIIMIFMIALVTLWAAGFCLTFICMCKGRWNVLFIDIDAALQQCLDTLTYGYALAISDFVGDAIIILIPLPFVG